MNLPPEDSTLQTPHSTLGRPTAVDWVARLDVALGAGTAAVAFALYPPGGAMILSVFLGGALLTLGRMVRDRNPIGYVLQTLLLFVLAFPIARVGWPFGLAPMVCVLHAWARSPVRREFGLGRSGHADPDPDRGSTAGERGAGFLARTAVVGLAVLGLTLAGQIVTDEPPLYGGALLGWLQPLAGSTAIRIWAGLALVASVGLLARSRWAYWLAPSALTLPLTAVHPLGKAVLPLLMLWPSRPVAGVFERAAPRPWSTAALLLIPMVGLGLTFRLVPAGTCPRHDQPLVLYGWHEEPFLTGQTPTGDRPASLWDAVKVTCIVCELAVHHRDLLTQCLTARFSGAPDLGRSFRCPFDRMLRERLGDGRIPPNQFEQITPRGRLISRCRTCSQFGLVRVEP